MSFNRTVFVCLSTHVLRHTSPFLGISIIGPLILLTLMFLNLVYFKNIFLSWQMCEVDPELLRTYEKLGVPLHERARLAGVAVDAVFDSVSVATTFRKQLAEVGVIFCSFSEAVKEHPELIKKYLGDTVERERKEIENVRWFPQIP